MKKSIMSVEKKQQAAAETETDASSMERARRDEGKLFRWANSTEANCFSRHTNIATHWHKHTHFSNVLNSIGNPITHNPIKPRAEVHSMR